MTDIVSARNLTLRDSGTNLALKFHRHGYSRHLQAIRTKRTKSTQRHFLTRHKLLCKITSPQGVRGGSTEGVSVRDLCRRLPPH